MRKEQRRKLIRFVKQNRYRSAWQKFVRAMACVVVFCTTYALILPAITMERDYICGLEEHVHSESCYTQETVSSWLCTLDTPVAHTHDAMCVDNSGNLICQIAEAEAHVHEESCWTVTGHTHGEGCSDPEGDLTCQLQETPEKKTLVCTIPELGVHQHTLECISTTVQDTLICGQEEHWHTDVCLPNQETTGETKKETVDGQPEITDGQTEIMESLPEKIPMFASSGISPAADTVTYVLKPVNANELKEGVDYVVYTGSNDNYVFLTAKNNTLGAIHANGTGLWTSPTTPGYSWTRTDAQMEYKDISEFTWRVRKSGNSYYLDSQSATASGLIFNDGGAWMGSGLIYNTSVSGAGCRMATELSWLSTGYLRYNNGWTGTGYRTQASTMYFAEISVSGATDPEPTDPTTQPTNPPSQPTDPSVEPSTEATEPTVDTSYPDYPNYPHAVHTGDVHINRLRFYNICEGNGGVSALANCAFEIKGIDNSYTRTIYSGNVTEIDLPSDIPDGKFTITEVSTPDGYMRDTRYTREFWIQGGKLQSQHNIGTFINHNLDQLTHSKTGEVEDYNNRIYQILLEAESMMQLYEMEPIDVLFVVDQSNSMLFPSGMNALPGKTLTLALNGSENVSRNQAVLDSLDKSKVHYIIADPEGTATAWAIWYDGDHWICQDSSYYAKAKHNNSPGYQTTNELAIFPTYANYSDQPTTSNGQKARANGAGLDKNLSGSSLGKDIDKEWNDTKTYQLYTAVDEYNRLHYLEESMANLIYALADTNPANRVTVVPFTKTVEKTITVKKANNTTKTIQMPAELNTENADDLVQFVSNINTSGGTRQDLALQYTYDTYLRNANDGVKKYTVLITDGAPVESDDKSLSAIYADIDTYGDLVASKSTLMAVGLGLESVQGGKDALLGIATPGYYYGELSNASELLSTMQNILFQGFRPTERVHMQADLVDEISDSFYPIAWVNRGTAQYTGRTLLSQDNTRDWILLQPGDWITRDGKFTTNSWERAGQLQRKEDGTFYIQWKDLAISNEGGWNGTFYVKAKEDFIGGNAIDTNKSATLHAKAVDDFHPEATVTMETPTVNVHLLDMNQFSSEETVYLGDTISAPLDVLKQYYADTRISKILSGSGDVLNKVSSAEGLEDGAFSLKYAMGRDLTEEEWNTLVGSGSVDIPYTYDDASSHGPVGHFTFRLEKTDGADYNSHVTTQACQPGGQPLTEDCENPAETYKLHITYTAYRLGEEGRPAANVNNGTGSPGTEVGTGATLATGLGTVEKENVHEVHVISGAIRITKQFAEGVSDTVDRTFTFHLHRLEDGDDTSADMSQTITIPAGAQNGSSSIIFGPLKRGTYTVKEGVDDVYTVKEITVQDSTNCYSDPAVGGSAMEVTFHMGNNTTNEDVIGKDNSDDRFTSYIDPVNGVFGEALFSNTPIVYEGEVPVTKIWDDGNENHAGDEVYVVLFENGAPLLDADGKAKLLRLDASANWQGSFTVVLRDKYDKVTDHDYSVREVSRVSDDTAYQGQWQSAILVNDGSAVYYKEALEAGRLITVGSFGYIVQYEPGENGAWTVTNMKSYLLPETGGIGTHLYTFSGLLLMMAALMYGYSQRRKMERRASR